jgi:non-ribosomal peptide synthetase-like protein
VCTDLLTIGDGSIIRKDSFLNGYRAQDGLIQTGPVSLGKDSFVGEMAVLDIETSVGDGAQLGHSSSLHAGQSIPDGERRYGTPARQRTDVDYRAVEPTGVGMFRKVAYSIAELFAVVLPLSLMITAVVMLIRWLVEHPGVLDLGSGGMPDWAHLADFLLVSLVLFLGMLLFGLTHALTVPRLLNLAIKPDKVYRLYGFHYWAHRTIERATNINFLNRIFGDSSYIVHYLSWLGYDLSPIVQTGSNFGAAFKHTTPYLVKVGSGTMIADGLSSINADYSSTSFRVSQVTIGGDTFIGNHVAYPSQSKTGDNCLLASKVTVPLEGEVREGVGLLGSPAFEIPRTVLRDSMYEVTAEERRRRLAFKNKHNLVTIGLFLLVRWIFACGLFLLVAAAAAFYGLVGEALAITLVMAVATLLRIFYFVLVENATRLFRPLQPQQCSIYDRYFWFHERFWKLSASINEMKILQGTPLRSFAWRLSGIRLGKRLFDDGCDISEPTMVTIGDDCMLNMGSIIQPHSQEDGGFKSDRIKIGAGCTVGVQALVHYGVTMGDGVQLAPHTFVMKGEEVPSHARWGENPAREVREIPSAEAVIGIATSPLPAASCGGNRLKGGQPA